MKTQLLCIVFTFLASCDEPPVQKDSVLSSFERPQPRTEAEVVFITAELNALQPRSIAENREFCGYLGLNPAGDFAISPPKRGSLDGCTPNDPPASLQLIASYHTHAAYSYDYDSETPSPDDLMGDIAEGVDGYIATPGGRVWFNDAAARTAILLCDLNCIFADPHFQPDPYYPVANRYSLRALIAR